MPVLRTTMLARIVVLAAFAAALVGVTVLQPPPAQAAARVSVANSADGAAAIDPTYATELQVSGGGFQSIRGGHGGVYVFFGTVGSGWRPSQGGATGRDYFYVPDSESADNRGYQRYVAFPGSDTASSANGGTMSATGAWSTTITVPGAVFQAVDRSGNTRSIDCRKVTCGIITVGAHGVVNATNETFTPVRVTDLYGGAAPSTPAATDGSDPGTGEAGTGDAGAEEPGAGAPTEAAAPRGPVTLEVDRTSATAGNVLSFSASGLTPDSQVTAILDDGLSANGPFMVGPDGRVAGVVSLPASLEAGTHELRLYGLVVDEEPPLVRFAVAAADAPVIEPEPVAADTDADTDTATQLAPWFFAVAVLVLVGALVRLLLLRRTTGVNDA